MEKKKRYIEDIIWRELVHAMSWEQYVSDYTGYRLDLKKWGNIAAIIISSIGAILVNIPCLTDYTWVISIAFLLTIVSLIITGFQKEIAIDPVTLSKMLKFRSMYISYYDKIERLFIEMREDELAKKECEDRYYKIRECIVEIEESKDYLNIHPKKRLMKKVERRVKERLSIKFNYPSSSFFLGGGGGILKSKSPLLPNSSIRHLIMNIIAKIKTAKHNNTKKTSKESNI